MDRKMIHILALFILLIAPVWAQASDKYKYQSDLEFEITVPFGFSYYQKDSDGMYFGYSEESEFGHFYIQTYEYLDLLKFCSSESIGNTKVNELNVGDTTLWAKMLTLGPHGSFPDAFCRPAYDGCSNDEVWVGTCQSPSSTYALCSEKDGKMVGICLYQQTDNPQLAEDIFSTFRWLDENAEETIELPFSSSSASETHEDIQEETIASSSFPGMPIAIGLGGAAVLMVFVVVFRKVWK
jgi:hypothetical protein